MLCGGIIESHEHHVRNCFSEHLLTKIETVHPFIEFLTRHALFHSVKKASFICPWALLHWTYPAAPAEKAPMPFLAPGHHKSFKEMEVTLSLPISAPALRYQVHSVEPWSRQFQHRHSPPPVYNMTITLNYMECGQCSQIVQSGKLDRFCRHIESAVASSTCHTKLSLPVQDPIHSLGHQSIFRKPYHELGCHEPHDEQQLRLVEQWNPPSHKFRTKF